MMNEPVQSKKSQNSRRKYFKENFSTKNFKTSSLTHQIDVRKSFNISKIETKKLSQTFFFVSFGSLQS